ncbi:glycosyltransferase [Arenimonas daejeonensis]|uniref:glycosyltransferase n=1 Tax=Arenimonas daejeonensis TaxID=370777 RepID=UPI00131520B9|nr:glycosyltransferase [Arenimonas daejeonensis]
MPSPTPQRILLVAYEFPPSPSPQSIRWAYLASELVALGHDVHVLAPEHSAHGAGLPALPPGLTVHRTFAGPLMGLLAWRARRGRPAGASAVPPSQPPGVADDGDSLNWKGRVWHTGLNWKGRMFARLQKLLQWLLFPDQRAEWKPWARRRFRTLVAELRPDVVISSHEPATTIEIGLDAVGQGVRWIVDMGDPVLAPYTPRRWRRRAGALEQAACRRASHVLVTTAQARDLLMERHGLAADRCTVLTQGHAPDPALPADGPLDPVFDPGLLELLYTGSFYGFRRHDALIEAVLATPGVRLNIASVNVPDDIRQAARTSGGAIRLLGFMPHLHALKAQRRADVLVNIANDNPCQVPGKLYEYLGAGRPILHLGDSPDDAAGHLLADTGGGVVCPNEPAEISRRLEHWRHSKLDRGRSLSRRGPAAWMPTPGPLSPPGSMR